MGSSTYLTDNFGRPSHYYETLPFGEMMVEHNQSKYYKVPYPTTNTGSYDNKWKFNGKELDDATGMYYYGARYYDPRISIFVSVDQMVESTMTPYQYVSNNPVMRIDPTGMNDHDYKLNKDGSLEKIRDTKDNFDRIFNEEGTESTTVSKGFMNGSEKENNMFVGKWVNQNYGKSDTYNISNEEVKSGKGKNIFNFFARNTGVEYDYNEFTNTTTGGRFGTLQTSHISDEVRGVQKLVKSVLDISEDVRWDYSVHNHPNARTIKEFLPTGWQSNGMGGFIRTVDPRDKKPYGDRGVFDAFKSNSRYNNRMPQYHHVISPYLNKTIRYNDKSFNFIN